jgi:hypothetical protein
MLFDPQRHFGGQGGATVEQGRQSGSRDTDRLRFVGHRQAVLIDDVAFLFVDAERDSPDVANLLDEKGWQETRLIDEAALQSWQKGASPET